MNQPVLTVINGVFVLKCTYHDRHIPKQANFSWHGDPESCYRKDCPGCRAELNKTWYTVDPLIAASMIEHADELATTALKVKVEQTQAMIAASRADDSDFVVPAPEGLAAMPYQRAGVNYALNCFHNNRGCIIGDQMGLGKTIQAIGCINSDSAIQTALIVCPAGLKINWKRELQTWLTKPRSMEIAWPKEFPDPIPDILIINYDILRRFYEELRSRAWDLIVIDEAHMLKNHTTIRSKQIYGGKRKTGHETSYVKPIPASRKLLLTGTPIENRPKEIYRLATYCDPTLWKNEWQFLNTYYHAETEWIWRKNPKTKAPEQIKTVKHETVKTDMLPDLQRRLRSSVMIRRLKSQVLKDLPPKRRQVIELPVNGCAALIKNERQLYFEIKERKSQLLRTDKSFREELAALRNEIVELEGHLSTVRKETGLAKIPQAIEHIENCLEEQDKLVVMAYHREVVETLHEHFGAISRMFYGGMGDKARQQSVDSFQTDTGVNLFIGSIIAAGVGITLTAASHEVFVEMDWVPGKNWQAEDRIHRIGQEEPVLIQYLPFENSVDTIIANSVIGKQVIIENTLDSDTEV